MTWGVSLSVSYYFAFSYCSWVSQGKNTEVAWHFLLQWPRYVRPLHHDLPVLGCPAGMSWFHWVRQGCGPSVITFTSFLWVWFHCVCALMPSCNTYHLIWVSLTLGMRFVFTAALAQPIKTNHSHILGSLIFWDGSRSVECISPMATLKVCDKPHSVYGICISLNKLAFTLLYLLLNFLCVKPRIHTWLPISETCLRPRMWPSSLIVSFLMKQTENRSCIWSYQGYYEESKEDLRGSKEPLDNGERGEWKSWVKTQH